jgi:phosphatidylserine decarboxylase
VTTNLTIKGSRVEQVNDLTYSLDALLGVDTDNPPESLTFTDGIEQRDIMRHREFANMNGIEWSLDQLVGVSLSCSPEDVIPTTESWPQQQPANDTLNVIEAST